jgi:hypothetical protein
VAQHANNGSRPSLAYPYVQREEKWKNGIAIIHRETISHAHKAFIYCLEMQRCCPPGSRILQLRWKSGRKRDAGGCKCHYTNRGNSNRQFMCEFANAAGAQCELNTRQPSSPVRLSGGAAESRSRSRVKRGGRSAGRSVSPSFVSQRCSLVYLWH